MKLGISYNLFDGEELLESSIKSIREEAHHINVVFQTTSYYGNKSCKNLQNKLISLKEKGLIDEIYYYNEDFLRPDKHYYERKKRDIGLSIARKNGCTHFLSMDVDEFYDKEQLKRAKNFIKRKKIKTSAVSIFEYLKKPEYVMINGYTFEPVTPYNFYVPFIMKIHRFLPQSHKGRWYPCLVDPTRALNNKEKFYLFPVQDIVMHHMSTVRKDLDKKYKNSNINLGSKEIIQEIRNLQNEILEWDYNKNQILNGEYSVFRGKLIKKVPNKFHINI